jgi:hypothetical protein
VTDSSEPSSELVPGGWGTWRRLSEWTVANPIVAVTIAGLLVYAIQRVGAAWFYSHLGFTPEEVGLGYATTLARSIPVAVLVVLVYLLAGFALVAVAGVVRVLRRSYYRVRGNTAAVEEMRARGKKAWATTVRELGSERLPNALAAAFLILPLFLAFAEAGGAAGGTPVEAFIGSWQAEAARVHVLDPIVPLPDGSCVLYLGQADGQLALYDPATRTSWRVPVNVAVIETGGDLSDVQQVPEDCPMPG